MALVILANWYSCPPAVSSHRNWLRRPRKDDVWLPRLGHQRCCSFQLGLLDHSLWGDEHHQVVRTLKHPWGEKVRFLTKSQHNLASHGRTALKVGPLAHSPESSDDSSFKSFNWGPRHCRAETRYCCCSVTPSCPTLCNPMDCSMPGFPVLHYLLEFAQTHVHWVDAIQSFRPLSPPSPFAFNLSDH